MWGVYRSAIRVGASTVRSCHVAPKSPSLFSSFTRPITSPASRFAMVLGTVESMMPLHSAVASARLKSSLAAAPTCWSMLSQGFATPL